MIIYKSDGVALIHIKVDDASYRYREIMGDSKVYLEFALTQYVDIEIGSYVDFQGERYMLMAVADVTIQHNRDYEYKVTFEGPQARFSKYRVHNPVDGRLVFEMTAYPQEHLAVIISNLNEREGAEVWSAGACITGAQKTMSYNHTKLNDALTALANLYDTEWEVTAQKQIHLNKLEYNAGAPLALAYGRNAGFKPGVGRTNYGELGQIERVYIQGGDRNISLKEYGSKTLLLPKDLAFKFDGEKFRYYDGVNLIEESGFNASKAVDMITDGHGYSVMLASAGAACNEESLDLTDIYPKRVGYVTDVRYLYDHQYLTYAEIAALGLTEEEWLKVQVDIIDSGISADLDYAQYLLANDEPLTVIFQDGMLGGREFSATFCKEPRMAVVTDPETGVETEVEQRPGNRFELVRGNFNGIEMPNATFRPNAAAGATQDTYIVVNCYLPDEYICDKAHASGAEFDALRQAAKFLYANKDIQLTFKGEIDDLYSKRNWLNVGGKLVLGGCVSFTHPQVQREALTTRIVAIKDYINNPYSPEVTLSNESVKGGLTSRLSQMKGQTAHVLYEAYALERYARRSFRDAKETMAMLEDALLEGFSERISPIAVQTMQLLLGDESLQFRYVNAKVNPVQVSPGINYDAASKKLICNAGIIQHMTLGIDTLSNTHADSEYKFWDITRFESPYLGDALADKKYYLYAKCNKAAEGETGYQTAEYVLSETAIAMNSVEGYYHLLVGILNSESEGDRSFVTLFGFTEVLPGRITTDKIVSGAGTTYWDLVQNILQMGDKLHFDPVNGLILNTPLVQTGSGDPVVIGAWCGEYNAARTYKLGDEVWWQAADGTVSTYRYINSVPDKGHAPNDDNYWQFVAKGVKGADAESPVFADLDNEMDGVVVNSNGKTAAQYTLTTNVSMWYGTVQLALSEITFSGLPTGVTASGNTSTGAITFTIASGTSLSTEEITIVVKGTFGNVTYTRELTFTIAGVKTGTDGDDAIIYSLLPSVTSVKKNKSGVYSVANVSCKKMKRVGQNGIAETTDGTLKYTLDGNSTEHTYSSAIPTTHFASNITFLLYIGSTLVDRETVPLIEDGSDGTDGDDGNDGNGIASITEDYARSTNGNTPPSSWSSTKPSQQAGYFIWTRRTIKFTDTSMSDFVTYQAVYCAQDGDPGDDGRPGPSSPYRGVYDSSETYYGNYTRCDIVYYNGQYYQALSTAPTSSFSGKIPTNTAYWASFGSSFSNIATGLIFAVRAVIENAVVRMLETSDTLTKRIIINNNQMEMYDDNNVQKLLVSGDDVEIGTPTASYSTNGNGVSHSYNQQGGSGQNAETFDICTFVVSSNNTSVRIPVLKLIASIAMQYYGGSIDNFSLYINLMRGNAVVENIYSTSQSMGTGQTSFESQAKNYTLSAGTYRIQVGVSYEWSVDLEEPYFNELSFDLADYTTGNIVVSSASAQMIKIGANGIAIHLGNSFSAIFALDSGTPTMLLQGINGSNQAIGLRLTSANGVQINRGSGWTAL